MKDEFVEEEYSVKVVRSKATGVVLREYWRVGGRPHSLGDRPAVLHYDDQGRIKTLIWMNHGKCHREHGPAHIEIDPDSKVAYEEYWMIEGHMHREGGLPAFTIRDRLTGEVTRQRLYSGGERRTEPTSVEPRPKI